MNEHDWKPVKVEIIPLPFVLADVRANPFAPERPKAPSPIPAEYPPGPPPPLQNPGYTLLFAEEEPKRVPFWVWWSGVWCGLMVGVAIWWWLSPDLYRPNPNLLTAATLGIAIIGGVMLGAHLTDRLDW